MVLKNFGSFDEIGAYSKKMQKTTGWHGWIRTMGRLYFLDKKGRIVEFKEDTKGEPPFYAQVGKE